MGEPLPNIVATEHRLLRALYHRSKRLLCIPIVLFMENGNGIEMLEGRKVSFEFRRPRRNASIK